MREFTDEEYYEINYWKPKCLKKAGESSTCNRRRYTKICVGKLPGDFWKTDSTIKFEVEITPADQPHQLNFRISGHAPAFVDGKPTVSLQDIINTTIDYSVDRHHAYFLPPDDPQATELVLMEAPIEEELKTLMNRFFEFVEKVCAGYAYLLYAMKVGYRFTGVTEWNDSTAFWNHTPEDFMK